MKMCIKEGHCTVFAKSKHNCVSVHAKIQAGQDEVKRVGGEGTRQGRGELRTGDPDRSSCDKMRKISLIITEAGSIRQTVGSHLKTQEGRGKTRGHNYAPLAAPPSSS